MGIFHGLGQTVARFVCFSVGMRRVGLVIVLVRRGSACANIFHGLGQTVA